MIENEFGEVGVDEKLLGAMENKVNEEVIEVMNGCICCTVRGDLVEALKRLYKKVKSFLDNEAGDLLQQQEFVIRNGLPPQHPNHHGGSHQDQIMLSSANNHFSAGSNGSQQ